MIRTPDQRLRVFVSSTLGELATERAAVRESIERLRLTPVMFELGARPHPPRALYRAYLAQSHVFVGIYAERYGWVAPGEEVSGLEDEYRLSGRLPRLLYVREPAPAREARLTELLERIRAEDTASYRRYSTAEELAGLVEGDLATLMTERFEAATAGSAATSTAVPEPPVPLTPTVGRDREIEAIAALVSGGARLVTVTGPGGVGKSRVALEVARRLRPLLPDAVAFLPLEAVATSELVMTAIAARLGVVVEGQATPAEVVRAFLRDRRMLLLLDNFEHVVGAAPAVAEVLDSCPGLQALVTSRRPLRLRGEREYPLAPLAVTPLPDGTAPAVELFVERAAAVRPHFGLTDDNRAAVDEIVRRLDGLPLALELAAARMRFLTPDSLLARLDRPEEVLGRGAANLPARQQSLNATLDWSHDLLTPGERVLFARMSYFAGGATLQAVEEVCSSEETGDVFEGVSALLENSLLVTTDVNAGEPRLGMLGMVRAYARRRLDERDEAGDVAVRHLAWCARLAEAADPTRSAGGHHRWPELEAEAADLRLAARFALAAGHLDRFSDLAHALLPWLWLSGHIAELRSWVEPALHACDPDTEPGVRARLAATAGAARFFMGDYRGADAATEEALRLARSLADEKLELEAAVVRAVCRTALDDLTGAEELLVGTIEGAERLGIVFGTGYAASILGTLRLLQGRLTESRELHERALAMARSHELAPLVSQELGQLALVDLAEGDTAAARRRLAESARVLRPLGRIEGLAYVLDEAAMVAVVEGRPEDAARAMAAGAAIMEKLRMARWPLLRRLQTPITEQVEGVVAADCLERVRAEGRAGDPWEVLDRTLGP